MKRLVSVIMVMIMVLTFSSGVFATDTHTTNPIEIEPFRPLKEISIDLNDIPVYITVSNNQVGESVKEAVQTIINEDLDSKEEIKNDNSNIQNNEKGLLHITNADFETIELSALKKEEIIKDPLFFDTLLHYQKMIDEGLKIKYINFFMKQPYQAKNGDPGDIDFWESNCPYLGSYDGYKFLYLESSMGVETNEIDVGENNRTVNWTTFLKVGINAILTYKVDGIANDVHTFIGVFSDIFKKQGNPINVTVGKSGGYIKMRVAGDVYIRTVLIRDDHNRVPGYAYYPWGSTGETRMSTTIRAKWPVSKRPGGTFNYKQDACVYPKKPLSTPGFNGNPRLYRSIINLYNNKSGYFTYDEYIDVYSVVFSMMSN